MKPLILICSKDVELFFFLAHILGSEGYATQLVSGREEIQQFVATAAARVVILECGPGNDDGVSLCAWLKQNPETKSLSVIALISSGSETQYIELLKCGVDESFARPVQPAILLESVRARSVGDAGLRGAEHASDRHLRYRDIEVDLATLRVRRHGVTIPLGPIEFKLLRCLMKEPGRVHSRTELIAAAWPPSVFVEDRTVDVHIGRLRKSLKSASDVDAVRTVRTAGYALDDQPDQSE